LSVGLSLLPVTSVMTIAIRSLFFRVPAWEIAASAAIASVCGGLAVWLASKALRMSLLRYGQRLKWRDLFARHYGANWRPGFSRDNPR
jgi:membrane protein YqaA with SNARE-associated domain